jgi:hypothetical protein
MGANDSAGIQAAGGLVRWQLSEPRGVKCRPNGLFCCDWLELDSCHCFKLLYINTLKHGVDC